jgi:signal-transduction protein with cAMP-binding, CBS, and nucleotidyltransferase domain
MAERGIRHLAVTDTGKIVGMLSVRDLLKYFKNWGTL